MGILGPAWGAIHLGVMGKALTMLGSEVGNRESKKSTGGVREGLGDRGAWGNK